MENRFGQTFRRDTLSTRRTCGCDVCVGVVLPLPDVVCFGFIRLCPFSLIMTPPLVSGYIVSPIVYNNGAYLVVLDDQHFPVIEFEGCDSRTASYISINGLYFAVSPNIVSDQSHEITALREKISALNQTLKEEESKLTTLSLQHASLTFKSESHFEHINSMLQVVQQSHRKARLWRSLFLGIVCLGILCAAASFTFTPEPSPPTHVIQTIECHQLPKIEPRFIVIEEDKGDVSVSSHHPPQSCNCDCVPCKEMTGPSEGNIGPVFKEKHKPKDHNTKSRRLKQCAEHPHSKGCASFHWHANPFFTRIFEQLNAAFIRSRGYHQHCAH